MPGKTSLLRFVQVILIGIQSGRFVDQWFILGLSLRSLDAPALSQTVRMLGAAMGLTMPANAAVVAVLFAAILIQERDLRSLRGKLTVAALVLFLAVVAITIVHELPLIARIEAMDTARPPAGWRALLMEWFAGHTVRTLLDLGLFVTVVAAFRLDGRSTPRA